MKRLGDSVDWSRERFTMDEGLSRAVREVFVRLYRKGLVYRGNRIINWCPRCHTALSDEEVNKVESEGKLYFVQYPIKGTQKHVTVATTRPETMLGDVAVAVHPKDKRFAPLKEDRDPAVPAPRDPDHPGRLGRSQVRDRRGQGDPAHDLADFEMGQRHQLPSVKVMDENAVMNENAGDFQGLTREEARKRIVEALTDRGLGARGAAPPLGGPLRPLQHGGRALPLAPVVREDEAARRARLCGDQPRRADDPAAPVGEGLPALARGDPRLVHLAAAWWGHRILVWTCPAARSRSSRSRRRPSARSGSGELAQDPDVLDTWFSSWLWPFSTLGWPEETADLKRFYPSSVMVTGPDIIFFWVARMVMAGYEFMGSCPFPQVYLHGIVRDAQGRKLSKSLGNSSDPIELMDRFGADSLRYTLVLLSPQGADIHGFSDEKVDLGRHFANKLWNAFRLVHPHLRDFTPDEPVERPALRDEDLWILSAMASTVRSVTKNLRAYRIGDAAKDIYDFTWREFCDWYLEMAKPRLYAGRHRGRPDRPLRDRQRLQHRDPPAPSVHAVPDRRALAFAPGHRGGRDRRPWPVPARGARTPRRRPGSPSPRRSWGRNLRSEMNIARPGRRRSGSARRVRRPRS